MDLNKVIILFEQIGALGVIRRFLCRVAQ